jgi:hypothetical protein
MLNRSEESMKEVAFEIARQYLISFTPYKKSQIALVVHDKGTNSKKFLFLKLDNDFMSKFVFVEHKSNQEEDKKKDVVYFRYKLNDNLFILIN